MLSVRDARRGRPASGAFRVGSACPGAGMRILELSTNDLRHIQAAAAQIQAAVAAIQPGDFHKLEIP